MPVNKPYQGLGIGMTGNDAFGTKSRARSRLSGASLPAWLNFGVWHDHELFLRGIM